MIRGSWIRVVASGLIAVAVVGCSASAPARFYSLDSTATADGPPLKRAAVMVGPVTVPAAVDQPEFVVQVAPNRVEVDEFNRWTPPTRSPSTYCALSRFGVKRLWSRRCGPFIGPTAEPLERATHSPAKPCRATASMRSPQPTAVRFQSSARTLPPRFEPTHRTSAKSLIAGTNERKRGIATV